jgi:hypothetical protein
VLATPIATESRKAVTAKTSTNLSRTDMSDFTFSTLSEDTDERAAKRLGDM